MDTLYEISAPVPAQSPHNLLQEQADYGPDREWRVCVACALLNRTNGDQVRPIFDELMRTWHSPRALLDTVETPRVQRLLQPLGFVNQRTRRLINMTSDYLEGRPIEYCSGNGPYAWASVRIVCHGDLDAPTDDPWLKKYVEWRRSQA